MTDKNLTSDESILRLLKTTYSPDYSHRKLLQAVIEEYAKIVSDLREKIREFPQLESLEKAKDNATKKLQNAQGLLVPIRKIPAEILSEILYLAINSGYNDQFFDGNSWSYRTIRARSTYPPSLLFLRVCKLWKCVALDTPRLFTQIDLGGPCSRNYLAKVVSYVNHSGVLPLEVTLFPERWQVSSEEKLRTILEIRNNIHRISKLSVSETPMQCLFPVDTRTFLPQLRELAIFYFPQAPRRISSHPRDSIGVLDIPGILRIYISGNIRWERFLGTGMSLTWLKCHNRCHLAPSDLISLLLQSPNLTECYVDYNENEIPTDFPGSLPIIHLPRLQKIQITWTNEHEPQPRCLQEILQKLRTPNLNTLSIENQTSDEMMDILPTLSSWLCSTSSRLRELRLELGIVPPMPAKQLHTLLTGLPKLTDLSIIWTGLLSEAIDVLNRNINPKVCPRLTSLEYRLCDISVETVDKMIRSRLQSPGQPTGEDFGFLRAFHVVGGSWYRQELNTVWGDKADECLFIRELQQAYPDITLDFKFDGDL
ncbi:hypothetical protein M422DRAFT_780489 [Sphaerobolus stellatus SS14]|uniref:F-box domain-containing protein n=1 Tax=Sphaerobolus stellatus (strain SS14) TaxID=990650 RepID=A0A0C9V1Z8_SPHS4|nr:hypothetical protein M422DRAFT_780489 [Sphaerobolus stellatus SS14]